MVIVGNKSDLTEQRVIKFEDAESLANSLGVKYFETSVYIDKMGKDGTKIVQIFQTIARDIQRSVQDKKKK